MFDLEVGKTYLIGRRSVGFRNDPVFYTVAKINDKTVHTEYKTSYSITVCEDDGIPRVGYFWDVPDTERQFSMRIVSAQEVEDTAKQRSDI